MIERIRGKKGQRMINAKRQMIGPNFAMVSQQTMIVLDEHPADRNNSAQIHQVMN